jgi:hypothetical protein
VRRGQLERRHRRPAVPQLGQHVQRDLRGHGRRRQTRGPDGRHQTLAHRQLQRRQHALAQRQRRGRRHPHALPNEELGLARDWPISDWNEGDIFSALFDFDLDGRKDVYWGSTDYPATRSFLYRQTEAGKFEEVGEAVGLAHARAAGLALADIDRDGDLDVFVGSSTAALRRRTTTRPARGR